MRRPAPGPAGRTPRRAVPGPSALVALACAVLLAGCGEGSLVRGLLAGLHGGWRDPDPCSVLAAAGDGAVGSSVLLDVLKDPRPPVRRAAARELARRGPRAAGALPALLAALRAEPVDADVRYSIVMALSANGPPAAAALAEALDGPDHGVRYAVALSLARLGPAGAVAVPALTRALDDPEPTVRYAALLALVEIGPAGLPGLASALDSADRDLLLLAVRSLGRVGPPAAGLGPRLRAVAGRDPGVAAEVHRALRGLEGS